MGAARQETGFGLHLTGEETREVAKQPLEAILKEAFTRLAAETDGFNSEPVTNQLRFHYANLLMGFFEAQKKAYDGWRTHGTYQDEEIEMREPKEKVAIVLADGPTGEILNIAYNTPTISAGLKIAKDFNGEYDFGVFPPTITATEGQGDATYRVVFGLESIVSFERERYLERPNGNTKDTRRLDFADYHTTPK